MSAPNFFGTAAVMWPMTFRHPMDDGEGYVFFETTNQVDGMTIDLNDRYYKRDRNICMRTLEELQDLKKAVEWAIEHMEDGIESLKEDENK